MRGAIWLTVLTLSVGACASGADDTGTPRSDGDGPVVLSSDRIATATEDAGCTEVTSPGGSLSVQHLSADDAPPPEELYDTRPATAGDHLGEWVEVAVYEERPDERAVVHNHEHGAVSVWYDPEVLDPRQIDALTTWATARNEAGLANDAGAGVIVSPFRDELPEGVAVAFRSWTGGLDCTAFNEVAADGLLLERFGQAPEGNLAPSLDGVIQLATDA